MADGQARWTIRKTIQWTVGYLRERDIGSPRLETEILLAHALGVRRLDLYLDPERPLLGPELATFKTLVKARTSERKSIAHIVGYKEFYGVRLAVPPGVFVPRPETEELVERCLTLLPSDGAVRLLDLCTGSGAIPVAMLSERGRFVADAVEKTAIGAQTARANGDAAGVSDRLTIHEGDAVAFLAAGAGPYDIITCNPPYIPSRDIEHLMPEVAVHEPRGALDGGIDGLDLVRGLVPHLVGALAADGVVAMEYDGAHQTPALRQLFGDAGFSKLEFYRDLAGKERFMIAGLRAAS